MSLGVGNTSHLFPPSLQVGLSCSQMREPVIFLYAVMGSPSRKVSTSLGLQGSQNPLLWAFHGVLLEWPKAHTSPKGA